MLPADAGNVSTEVALAVKAFADAGAVHQLIPVALISRRVAYHSSPRYY